MPLACSDRGGEGCNMRLERRHPMRNEITWLASDGPGAMTVFISKVFKRIQQDAGGNGERIRQIRSVTTGNESEDSCPQCFFVLGLPNGLTVEIEYDSAGAQEVFYDLEITDVEWAANFFGYGYNDLRYRNFDRIAAAVHETVMALRITFQEWSDQYGIDAHLLGSRVTWNIWDRYSNVLPHVISIFALDANLQPSVLDFGIDCFGDTAEELQELFDVLSVRGAQRKALRSQGADGKVDLLAMQALAAERPLEESLRNWGCITRQNDCRDHYYSRELGHLQLHKQVPSETNLQLDGSSVRLYGIQLPDSLMTQCIESPITDIIDFEYFTSDMKILEARNGDSFRGNFVAFEIDQPVYYFCSLSGRYWR